MTGLSALLGRDPRDLAGSVIAVLGSGGKTTLLAMLARELSSFFPRVLISTGTKVHPFPDIPSVSSLDDLPGAFARERVVFLGRQLGAEGKLGGVPGLTLAALRREAEVVLLESDGARRRPFKVHLPHDPPLPREADLALVLVGAAALGLPVSETTVHRCDWIPAWWPMRKGQTLTADAMAQVLIAPDGYLGKAQAVPARIMINQADSFPDRAAALARELGSRWPGPILVGSVKRGKFVAYDNPGPRCSLIVLAAGRGERFGGGEGASGSARGDKRLFPLRGRPLLAWTLASFREARVMQKLLVLGPGDREPARLGIRHGFAPVFCPEPELAMSASLQTGLAAGSRDNEGLLVALGDMPAVRPATVSALLAEALRRPGRALRPAYRGRAGHPVFLPRSCFAELAALSGDMGARELLPSLDPFVLECDDPGVILDLDRPEQAPELEALLSEEPDPDAV